MQNQNNGKSKNSKLTKLSNVLVKSDKLKELLKNISKFNITINSDDDIGNIILSLQDTRHKLLLSDPLQIDTISMYDKLLYELILIHRETNSKINSTTSTFCIIPRYDCLISDMHPPDYDIISNILGKTNLEKTTESPELTINGIFHGMQDRLICPLIISKGQIKIWVIFLIDTGSAFTYLNEDTFNSLFSTKKEFNNRLRVNLHGLEDFSCLISSKTDKKLGNVNIIGQDFLRRYGVILKINYNFPSYTIGAFVLELTKKAGGRSIKKKSHKP
jgi:hypothetical protein